MTEDAIKLRWLRYNIRGEGFDRSSLRHGAILVSGAGALLE